MSLVVGMLTAMEFALDQAECTEAAGGGCGAAVCVGAVDVAGHSEERLRARIGLIGRAESKLAAMKSQAVAEMARQHNAVAAERAVREELQSSKRAARHDVKAAERLAALEATSEALAAGDIPQDHARLIARASSDGPIDEHALVDAAKEQTYDDFEKTLRRQQQDLSGDDGQAILDRQKQKRTARMFNNRDTGMSILSAEFDPTTGQHIAAVVAEKERDLWNQEDPKARLTPQQRIADALAELILEPEKGKATTTSTTTTTKPPKTPTPANGKPNPHPTHSPTPAQQPGSPPTPTPYCSTEPQEKISPGPRPKSRPRSGTTHPEW